MQPPANSSGNRPSQAAAVPVVAVRRVGLVDRAVAGDQTDPVDQAVVVGRVDPAVRAVDVGPVDAAVA
jgi:hypothetical protein